MKKQTITQLLALFALLLASLACAGTTSTDDSSSSETPTPRPLMGFDFEEVCRRGTVDEVPAYVAEPGSGKIHPVLVFENRFSEANSFSQIYPSTLKFPVPWMVDSDGDFSTVEVVACLEKADTTFVQTCDYTDDDTGDEFLLDVYNATYDVHVYAAQSGEELGGTTLFAETDDCPMFHMFSNPKEDYFASVSMVELQEFLAPIVEP